MPSGKAATQPANPTAAALDTTTDHTIARTATPPFFWTSPFDGQPPQAPLSDAVLEETVRDARGLRMRQGSRSCGTQCPGHRSRGAGRRARPGRDSQLKRPGSWADDS
ncbi:hypothetical protein GCM10010104_33650 [Streptomyces indiaensis]|uniref:Uncharacterized protein n=1 Tax=Streptomyces indiaensis TaxID=284033 RepID=A0ABP5QHK1_9ACTN